MVCTLAPLLSRTSTLVSPLATAVTTHTFAVSAVVAAHRIEDAGAAAIFRATVTTDWFSDSKVCSAGSSISLLTSAAVVGVITNVGYFVFTSSIVTGGSGSGGAAITVTWTDCDTFRSSASVAVTTTDVVPTPTPVTVRVVTDTAAVAMAGSVDFALSVRVSPSGSPKAVLRSTVSDIPCTSAGRSAISSAT